MSITKRTVISYGSKRKVYYTDEQDLYHREDGPAIEDADGDCWWFKHGLLHRLDGPAAEFADGHKEWFIEDKFIPCSSQEEFEKMLRLKSFW